MNTNDTFRGSDPSWANACVGNNGMPSYVEYSKGFSQAANVLIDLVLSQRGIKYPVDDFIYPVCFNMRHSIELRLKGAIEELKKIAEIKGKRLVFDLPGSHDIGNIWCFFKVNSESLDRRYIDINSTIEPIILDVAKIDSTGQTFRYPVDTESQRHLTEVATINFLLLKKQFNYLESQLDTLHQLDVFLLSEYGLRTFTTKLSRLELFKLTNDLPQRSKWSDPSFIEVKNRIKKKYDLSSNDLTKAINHVKKNYEMAANIEIKIDLKGISEVKLIEFITEWMKLNESIKTCHLSEGKFDVLSSDDADGLIKCFEEIKVRQKIKNEIWEAYGKLLSAAELSGLKALFYFARDLQFSEYYVMTYEYELKEAKYNQKNVSEFRKSFIHLLDKSNFLDNSLTSLYFLQHNELADQIVEKFQVERAFPWLERAKDRTLFSLPIYTQY